MTTSGTPTRRTVKQSLATARIGFASMSMLRVICANPCVGIRVPYQGTKAETRWTRIGRSRHRKLETGWGHLNVLVTE